MHRAFIHTLNIVDNDVFVNTRRGKCHQSEEYSIMVNVSQNFLSWYIVDRAIDSFRDTKHYNEHFVRGERVTEGN